MILEIRFSLAARELGARPDFASLSPDRAP